MKLSQTMSSASRTLTVAALLGMSALLPTLFAAEQKASSDKATARVEIPRSVFDSDPKAGKDPFFPKSTRRDVQVIPDPTPEPVVTDVTKALKLKGISGSLDQKLAIINNRTFAVGESDYIEVGTVKVHVLLKEIRQESVIVVVNNAHYKELKLREGV